LATAAASEILSFFISRMVILSINSPQATGIFGGAVVADKIRGLRFRI
jgi:hypothetical protein